MTDDDIRRIVREAVQETLAGLGFDVTHLQETQADMAYLRRIRKGSEELSSRIRLSIFISLVTTGLFLLWDGIKQKITGK